MGFDGLCGGLMELHVNPAPTDPLLTEFPLEQMLILCHFSLISFISKIVSKRIPSITDGIFKSLAIRWIDLY